MSCLRFTIFFLIHHAVVGFQKLLSCKRQAMHVATSLFMHGHCIMHLYPPEATSRKEISGRVQITRQIQHKISEMALMKLSACSICASAYLTLARDAYTQRIMSQTCRNNISAPTSVVRYEIWQCPKLSKTFDVYPE